MESSGVESVNVENPFVTSGCTKKTKPDDEVAAVGIYVGHHGHFRGSLCKIRLIDVDVGSVQRLGDSRYRSTLLCGKSSRFCLRVQTEWPQRSVRADEATHQGRKHAYEAPITSQSKRCKCRAWDLYASMVQSEWQVRSRFTGQVQVWLKRRRMSRLSASWRSQVNTVRCILSTSVCGYTSSAGSAALSTLKDSFSSLEC
ncbi:hypothetical protein EK21DRAFT_91918 [Setomelanomma holmii]|uniref:Uncharacterized protein n=1 Tax=Setomelanomma holmii TaxID=210430 RepID=A0A9P4LIX8_9PLEO|nr:hypothetical protein EK21DRAFT_91918 [Setomelanomma holmii]